MDKIMINVYDDDNKVVKTVEAKVVDIKFKTVRDLMELLNIEKIEDTSEMLGKIYTAWGSVIKTLNEAFPEMEDGDWDNVKVSELLPMVMAIMKSAFAKMLTLPKDSKN